MTCTQNRTFFLATALFVVAACVTTEDRDPATDDDAGTGATTGDTTGDTTGSPASVAGSGGSDATSGNGTGGVGATGSVGGMGGGDDSSASTGGGGGGTNDTCETLGTIGCCDVNVARYCDDGGTVHEIACSGGCGWFERGYYFCDGDGADPSGEHPLACP